MQELRVKVGEGRGKGSLQNVPLHAYKRSSPNHKKERHRGTTLTKKPETSLYEEQRWFQGAWTYTRFTKKERGREGEQRKFTKCT